MASLDTVPLPSVFPAFTLHEWNSTFNQPNYSFHIPSQAQSLRHHWMLPFPICDSHLRRSEGTAVGHIWVGWLSLTYPFIFPALPHFYSIKGAFIIYRIRPFEIGLEFSLLYYTEGVKLYIILERAGVCFLSFFYSIRESLMSKKKIFVLYILYDRLPRVRVRSYSIHALLLTP